MHPALNLLLFGSSLFGAGGTAGDMLGNEPSGVAFDFRSDRMLVRSASTPSLNFDGTIQQGIDASIISFTRATSASRTNGSGLIETVSSGIWRREYSPLTLSPLGYLPEPARTNLALRSDEFDNASWTKNGSTISANGSASPDGATTMDKMVESAANVAHEATQTITITAGATTTVTAYFKAAERTQAAILFENGADNFRCVFDSVGLTTNPLTGGTGTIASSSITSVGGSIYRLRMTGVVNAGSTAITLRVRLSTGGSGAYAGDGTSGAFFWGVQVEAGTYPTSYIPTTSATVTRNADVMTVALSKLPFSATAGTMIAKGQPSADTAFNHALWSIDDGTANERHWVYNAGAGLYRLQYNLRDNSSTLATLTSTTNDALTRFRSAVAFAVDDTELVMNGVSRAADAVSNTMPTVTTLQIGQLYNASLQYGAPIESLVYIPRRLSQVEMVARTA